MRVLLFSNLFPSSALPLHGSFLREREDRLAARLGFTYRVLHPLPLHPPLPGRGALARMSRLPRRELSDGVEIAYPRYFHLPKIGMRRQAERMVRGVRGCFGRIVKAFRPVLVDAHYLWPDACAALRLCKELGLPCFATARGSDLHLCARDPAVREALREALAWAREILAVSPALVAELEALAPGRRIHLAPNGVDLDRFRPGSRPPERRILWVGRLVPEKGLGRLLEALSCPGGRKLPDLHLVGSGPDRPRLQKRAGELGVAGRIHFLGDLGREEVARELRRGGVFALPSLREGWPNALMEALASGLPAVASGVGGVPWLSEGCPSVTLLPGDAGPGAWAQALQERLEALCRSPGVERGSIRTFAESLGWEAALDRMQSLYREYLE